MVRCDFFSRGPREKTQGGDIAGVLDALKIQRAALVTHDIGNMVGYAFAAQYRNRGIEPYLP